MHLDIERYVAAKLPKVLFHLDQLCDANIAIMNACLHRAKIHHFKQNKQLHFHGILRVLLLVDDRDLQQKTSTISMKGTGIDCNHEKD